MENKLNKNDHNVWLKTTDQMLDSLIGDEAKNIDMLEATFKTVKQLLAKSKFRLALLHQINENKGK
jgi:hypothetical protein